MNITAAPHICRTACFQPSSACRNSSEMMMMQIMQMMLLLNQSMQTQGGYLPAQPSFGAAPATLPRPGGSPLGGFLGQTSSGLAAGGSSPAQPLSAGGNSNVGSTLLQSINRSPVPPRCRPGYCYRGVKYHLRQIGVNLTGGSAYQAADQLANSGRFREVQVSRDQLRSLPAGAVVVWNRGNGRRHGHISIAMGDGREASD